jgi:predicted adenylyl cyclase CyaB
MSHLNIEIKARTKHIDAIRRFLTDHQADYKGVDIQIDTYFNVPSGRLKLRQGNIENSLIFYHRPNISGPKQSDFDLVFIDNGEELKSILTKAIGVKITVQKRREIYYLDHIKFHLDFLEHLGHFVEIEVMNKENEQSLDALREVCKFYMDKLGILEDDLVNLSYSDMLLASGTSEVSRFPFVW